MCSWKSNVEFDKNSVLNELLKINLASNETR